MNFPAEAENPAQRFGNLSSSDSWIDTPVVCVATPSFGMASEVWMYRQVTDMSRLLPVVLTWKRENQVTYPAPGISVCVAPASLGGGRIRRQWWCLRNQVAGAGRYRADRVATDWLLGFFAQHRPAVVLAQYSVTALRLLPICRVRGIPLVVHFHGYDISRKLRDRKFRSQLIKRLPQFAGCVCVATYQRDWLVEHGANPERVHWIPCGAPMHDIPLAAYATADGSCRFVMVGRLVEKKRPDLSLRAFARCLETHPDCELVVIGDGPLQSDCEHLCESLGIAGRATWMGSQPNEVVRKELAVSSVFIQHSVTADTGDKEGWPVAVAEAAGAGLPVVSTRHAGITDQVDEGETGFLVDEGDWEGMAERMVALAADPALRERMGRAAREKMVQYDVGNQVAQLEEVLLAAARVTP